MSALGDYIHLNYENYQHYGVSTKEEGGINDWEKTLDYVTNEIQKEQNNIKNLLLEARNIEIDYNNFFYSNESNNENFQKIFEEQINKKLQEQFGLMAGTFNTETLTVTASDLYNQFKNAISIVRKKVGKLEYIKSKTVENLLEKAQQVEKILKQNEFKKIPEIKDMLLEAKTKTKQIINELNKEIEKYGSQVKVSSNENIETLNNIIHQFNRTSLIYDQNGALFEWILPFIKFKGQELGTEELAGSLENIIKELMNQAIGNDNCKIDVQKDYIEELKNKEKIEVNEQITNNIHIKTISVRNKTDVIIEYKNNEENIIKKAISAKSTSHTSIKIVDSTTLYRILSIVNYENFSNHYLNIVTIYNNQKPDNERMELIKTANQLLQALIVRIGAEGYDVNNPAELLIVNDYTNKKIKVYNIKALVYLISQELIINNNKFSKIVSDINNSTIINQSFKKEDGDYSQRIAQLLDHISSIKISAHINSTALSTYLDELNKYLTV